MANFKRGKPKQSVACTLCTQHRWRGNASGRFKSKEEAGRHQDVATDEVAMRTKSSKRNWSRNKKVRSLKDRLVHLEQKRDEDTVRARRIRKSGLLDDWMAKYYAKEIAHCEQALAKLAG